MGIVESPPTGGQRTVLEKTGRYCLTENLWVDGVYQPWRWEGPTFFSNDKVVIEIGTDKLDLDLQGHSVGSDGRLVAAITTSNEVSPLGKKKPPGLKPFVDITVRNGTVNPTRGNRAILFAGVEPLEAAFSDVQEGHPARNGGPLTPHQIELDDWLWSDIVDRQIKNSKDYPVRNLKLQDLKIKSSMPAIVLQGANSVVSNNVIDTDSGTALQIHGPHAVIENNTIIVRCRKSAPTDINESKCLTADAPIRLIHADGAVIRNNRFIIEGSSAKRVLSVFNTESFVFEGNVIQGLDDLSQIATVFSGELKGELRGNRLDAGLARQR